MGKPFVYYILFALWFAPLLPIFYVQIFGGIFTYESKGAIPQIKLLIERRKQRESK